MPRFDPPRYMLEHGDATRLREAQHASVNLRGHYMGTMLGALGAATPSARDAIKANKDKIQAEINKVVPNLVSVNADGTLRVNDPISAIDRNIASIFSPAVKSAIDALPLGGPNAAALKTKLKTRPLTFFLDFFDPVLDAVRGALEAVMTRGINTTTAGFKNKTTKDTGQPLVGGFVYDLSTVPLPGLFNNEKLRNINVWLVQPGDELFDANSQRLILRLRMILAYIVLFFKKPFELQTELARAGLDLIFGKDDTVLVSTQGQEVNTTETPYSVDRLPAAATRIGAGVVYQLQESGAGGRGVKTTYYKLSTKGLADRKAALRTDYDRKYAAYVQDFKFWHPDFAARVGWVKTFEGKSESAAVAKVAGEYNLPQRFANEAGVYRDRRFQVTAGDALGGPMAVKNGLRADLKGLGSLGATGAEEAAVAKTAVDAATPVAAPTLLEQILSFFAGLAQALGAVSTVLAGVAKVMEEINKPAVAQAEADKAKAEADARRAEAESQGLQAQSESSSKKTMLIVGGALVLGLLYMQKRRSKA